MYNLVFPVLRHCWESVGAGLTNEPNENTSDIAKIYSTYTENTPDFSHSTFLGLLFSTEVFDQGCENGFFKT